jgi:hypothetical protein
MSFLPQAKKPSIVKHTTTFHKPLPLSARPHLFTCVSFCPSQVMISEKEPYEDAMKVINAFVQKCVGTSTITTPFRPGLQELEQLPYRELQALAKETGACRANAKAEDLVRSLVEHYR